MFDIEKLKAKIAKIKERLAQKERQLAALESRKNGLQRVVNDRNKDVSQKRTDLNKDDGLKHRIKNIENSEAKERKRLAGVSRKLEKNTVGHKSKIKRIESEIKSIKSKLSRKRSALRSAKARLKIQKKSQRVVQAKVDKHDKKLSRQRASLERGITDVSYKLSNVRARLEEAQQRLLECQQIRDHAEKEWRSNYNVLHESNDGQKCTVGGIMYCELGSAPEYREYRTLFVFTDHEVSRLTQQLNSYSSQLRRHNSSLDRSYNDRHGEKLESNLDSCNDKVYKTDNQIDGLEEDISELEGQLNAKNTELSNLRKQMNGNRGKVRNINTVKLRDLKEKTRKQIAEVKRSAKQVKEQKQRVLSIAQSSLSHARSNYDCANREYNKLKLEIKQIRDVELRFAEDELDRAKFEQEVNQMMTAEKELQFDYQNQDSLSSSDLYNGSRKKDDDQKPYDPSQSVLNYTPKFFQPEVPKIPETQLVSDEQLEALSDAMALQMLEEMLQKNPHQLYQQTTQVQQSVSPSRVNSEESGMGDLVKDGINITTSLLPSKVSNVLGGVNTLHEVGTKIRQKRSVSKNDILEDVREVVTTEVVNKGVEYGIKKVLGNHPVVAPVLAMSGVIKKYKKPIQKALQKDIDFYSGQDQYSTDMRDGGLEMQGLVELGSLPSRGVEKLTKTIDPYVQPVVKKVGGILYDIGEKMVETEQQENAMRGIVTNPNAFMNPRKRKRWEGVSDDKINEEEKDLHDSKRMKKE